MKELREELAAGRLDHRAIDEHVETLDHLSATRMDTHANCGFLYYFTYVLGMRRRPGVAMLRGSAVHESVEANAKSRIETGDPIPRSIAKDVAAEGFTRRVEEEDPEVRDDENLGASKDQSVNLAVLHYDEVAPTAVPLHSEAAFTLEWGDGPPIEGYVDLITTTPGGPVVVEEVKTAVDARTDRGKYIHKVQVPIYLTAFKELLGATEAKVSVLAQNTNKTKGTYHRVITHELLASDVNEPFIKASGNAMMGALRSHTIAPASPSYFLCSKKWCGFHEENNGPCPFGRKT